MNFCGQKLSPLTIWPLWTMKKNKKTTQKNNNLVFINRIYSFQAVDAFIIFFLVVLFLFFKIKAGLLMLLFFLTFLPDVAYYLWLAERIKNPTSKDKNWRWYFKLFLAFWLLVLIILKCLVWVRISFFVEPFLKPLIA